MDTEKYQEVQRKLDLGKSPSDEGPYYHHTHWESYKSASKGELGGTITGISVGSVVGLALAAVGLATGQLPLAAAALTVVGFAGAGLIYGVHKFANVGAVTGAVAAAEHQSELRMKSYEEGKFNEIKQEIGQIKSMLKGEPVKPIEPLAEKYDDMSYRKTHYAKVEPDKKNRYVFWEIAAIGLAVGLVAGAVLAGSGLAGHVLDGLIEHSGPLSGMNVYAASMAAMGAIGASFGINRDVFRRIFDKTDLWFKGIVSPKHHAKVRQLQVEAGEDIREEMTQSNARNTPQMDVTTAIMPTAYIDYPSSATYHRDRYMKEAEKALLSFDHTRATPQ
jgi:hypothetical protein